MPPSRIRRGLRRDIARSIHGVPASIFGSPSRFLWRWRHCRRVYGLEGRVRSMMFTAVSVWPERCLLRGGKVGSTNVPSAEGFLTGPTATRTEIGLRRHNLLLSDSTR